MSRIRFSLMLSLSFALSVILFLVLGVSFLTLYRFEEQAILSERQNLAQGFSLWLSQSLNYHMERLNYYNVEQICRSLQEASFESLPIAVVQVFDQDGRRVNISGRNLPDSPAYQTLTQELRSSLNQDRILGQVKISFSLEPSNIRLAQFRGNLALILFFALLAGALVMILLIYYTLSRPIQKLNLAAYKLSEHDWDVLFPVKRPDEVGLLARTLDHIRGSLKDSFHKTEDLINMRTAQLNEALQTQYTMNNVLIDQTLEMKRRTEELVASERDAALGRLTASIAHELNTPIGNSVTGVSLLRKQIDNIVDKMKREQMKKSDLEVFFMDSKEVMESIEGNLQKAAELTTSFKAVTTDQSSEKPRRFNISEYLNGVLITLLPRLKKTTHTLDISCPADLEITGYPGLLATIITNLAINAVFHAWEPERKNGKMTVVVQEIMDRIEIVFSDDGMGIKEENLDNIFLPYFTTKAGKGGSGLGLHIVRSLVWKMKGYISVDTIVGEGTVFTIDLPKEVDVGNG